MSSQQQKRGFRLPWGAERGPDGDATAAATLDPASPDPTSGVDSDDLDEGPFHLAGVAPSPTTEEAPASSDVPEYTAEAVMIDTHAQTQPTPDAEGGGWPDVDRPASSQLAAARPPIHVTGDPRPARRDNPLVAGLVKAMREAAISSRDEQLTRLQADAEARVESIRTSATSDAAELRKRAEGDIADIREWSKNEIARVRQETEERIDARRTALTGETERHAASVERLVTDVQSVVESFQANMTQFFQRLLAEDDPARLAALAEQAPEAPDLNGDGSIATDVVDESNADESNADDAAADGQEADGSIATDVVDEYNAAGAEADGPEAEAAEADGPEAEAAEADGPQADGLEADAAAAAEVAASEGLDLGDGNGWPAAAVAASRSEDAPSDATDADPGATRLLVSGLGSVAGISALKGALGQLPGVNTVSVSSGERGEFVFALTHDPGLDLASGITSLHGFGARITDATADGISVVAHEPAA
jgi:hypothetical protein